MSRAEEKIKMYTNVTADTLEEWRMQGLDMQRLAKRCQMLHFFITRGSIDQPWQHALLTVGYVRDAIMIPPDQHGNSVAHVAALIGDIALLNSLLFERKEDLFHPNNEGFHLAHFAAASENPLIIEWIANNLELAPLLQQENRSGVLPTHIAARSGVIENLTFFATNLPHTLRAMTRESTSKTVLDHALLSEEPNMLASLADHLDIQPGTADFRKSAFGSEAIRILTAAISLSYRLVYANIPDHTSCGLYCPKQNPQREDENTTRLSAIATASREKRQSGANLYVGLIALSATLRQQDRTTLKICSDVFWVIVDFANNFGPDTKEATLRLGLRNNQSFTYKAISHSSQESLPENAAHEESKTPSPM